MRLLVVSPNSPDDIPVPVNVWLHGLRAAVEATSEHHQLSRVLFHLHGHIHLPNLSLPMYSLCQLKGT